MFRGHPAIGYVVAFVSVGAATALQWWASDFYQGAPFLTIYPAVVITAFVGGYPAGLLSAVLAGLSQWYFFIPQYHWLAVLTYVVDAVVCVLLIEYVNRGLDRETQAKQHQALLKDELQHRIQNLFAVIQAVIRFSLPSNEARVSAAAIKDGLLDRLQALVDANRHVSDSTGEIALIDLIHGQMRVFAERYTVHGRPQVTLNPQLTQEFLPDPARAGHQFAEVRRLVGCRRLRSNQAAGSSDRRAVRLDGNRRSGRQCTTRRRLRRRLRLAHSRPVRAGFLLRRRDRLRADGPALQSANTPPAKHIAVDGRSAPNGIGWVDRSHLIHIKAAGAEALTFNVRLVRQSSLWDLSRAASTEPSHLWVVPVAAAYFCRRRNPNERGGLAHRGTRYRRPVRTAGSFCRTLPISAQASFLMRFLISRTVKSLPPMVRGSRSQVTGVETGAPGRARVEYGATAVASRELRK